MRGRRPAAPTTARTGGLRTCTHALCGPRNRRCRYCSGADPVLSDRCRAVEGRARGKHALETEVCTEGLGRGMDGGEGTQTSVPARNTNTLTKQQLSRRLDGYLADRRSSSAGSSTSREAVRVAEWPRAVHEPPSREESAMFAWANGCHAESKSQRQHRVGKCGGRYSRNSCFDTLVTSEERPMRFAT